MTGRRPSGTLDYMAPERFENRPVDGRTDVYSLACVLFECLTAQKPFPGADLPVADVRPPAPRPRRARASVVARACPPALDDVVARGMAKDPDRPLRHRRGPGGARPGRPSRSGDAPRGPPAPTRRGVGTPGRRGRRAGRTDHVVSAPAGGPARPSGDGALAVATPAAGPHRGGPTPRPSSPPPRTPRPRPRSRPGRMDLRPDPAAARGPGRSARAAAVAPVVVPALRRARGGRRGVLRRLAAVVARGRRPSPAARSRRPARWPRRASRRRPSPRPCRSGRAPGHMAVAPTGSSPTSRTATAGVLTVFDTATERATGTIPVPDGGPQSVAFSPDGPPRLRGRRHADSAQRGRRRRHRDRAIVTTTSPPGRRPFAAPVSPTARTVRAIRGRVDHRDRHGHDAVVGRSRSPHPHGLAFSPDGTRLYAVEPSTTRACPAGRHRHDRTVATIPVGKVPALGRVAPDRPLVLSTPTTTTTRLGDRHRHRPGGRDGPHRGPPAGRHAERRRPVRLRRRRSTRTSPGPRHHDARRSPRRSRRAGARAASRSPPTGGRPTSPTCSTAR